MGFGAADTPRHRFALTERSDRRKSVIAALAVHGLVLAALALKLTPVVLPAKTAPTQINFITLGDAPPAGSETGDEAPPKPQPDVPEKPEPTPPAPEVAEDPTDLDPPPFDLPSTEPRPANQAAAQSSSAEVAIVQGNGTLAFGAKTHGTGAGLDGDLMAAIGQAVATQISACWNMPRTNLPSDLVILMTVQFDREGNLLSEPTISRLVNDQPETVLLPNAYEMAAAEAVKRCSPVKLPAQYYPYWQAIDVQIFSSQRPTLPQPGSSAQAPQT